MPATFTADIDLLVPDIHRVLLRVPRSFEFAGVQTGVGGSKVRKNFCILGHLIGVVGSCPLCHLPGGFYGQSSSNGSAAVKGPARTRKARLGVGHSGN
jgi:hypothetical protein